MVVDLPDLPLTNGVPELIGGAFEAAYKRIYGRTFRDRSIQLVTWRLRLEGREARPALLAPPAQTAATQAPSRRTMWFDGGETPGQVLHRLALYPGQTVAGLATIHEPDSTTVVPPGWVARLRDDLNLLVEREAR